LLDELPLNGCGSNDRPLKELLFTLSPSELDDRPDDRKVLESSLLELNVRIELPPLNEDDRLEDELPLEKLREEKLLPLFDEWLLWPELPLPPSLPPSRSLRSAKALLPGDRPSVTTKATTKFTKRVQYIGGLPSLTGTVARPPVSCDLSIGGHLNEWPTFDRSRDQRKRRYLNTSGRLNAGCMPQSRDKRKRRNSQQFADSQRVNQREKCRQFVDCCRNSDIDVD
jgi:hypothetical protein